MAQITINIPDAVQPRVVDAICAQTGWDGSTTKAVWARTQIIKYVKSLVVAFEASSAGQAASHNQELQSEIDIDLT